MISNTASEMIRLIETIRDDEQIEVSAEQIARFWVHRLIDTEFPCDWESIRVLTEDDHDDMEWGVMLSIGFHWDTDGSTEVTRDKVIAIVAEFGMDVIEEMGTELHDEWIQSRYSGWSGRHTSVIRKQMDAVEELRLEVAG